MEKKGDSNKFKHLLLEKETMKSSYEFGSYHVLLTQHRVILKKKFLRKLIAFNFKEVQAIEYVRNFHVMSFIIALLSFAFSFVFYTKIAGTERSVFVLLFNLAGWMYLMKLVGVIFLVVGLYNLVHFLLDLYGKVTILLEYRQDPINIYTTYNDKIPEFIRKIETERKR